MQNSGVIYANVLFKSSYLFNKKKTTFKLMFELNVFFDEIGNFFCITIISFTRNTKVFMWSINKYLIRCVSHIKKYSLPLL